MWGVRWVTQMSNQVDLRGSAGKAASHDTESLWTWLIHLLLFASPVFVRTYCCNAAVSVTVCGTCLFLYRNSTTKTGFELNKQLVLKWNMKIRVFFFWLYINPLKKLIAFIYFYYILISCYLELSIKCNKVKRLNRKKNDCLYVIHFFTEPSDRLSEESICKEDIMLSDIQNRHIMTICVKNIAETINNWLNLTSCHRQPLSYGKCAWSQERVSPPYCMCACTIYLYDT